MHVIALKGLLERNEVLLLDVREPSEYWAEHIPGAYLYPLSQLDHLPPLPQGQQLVLQCQTGRRSARAAFRLRQRGLVTTELEGGLEAWKEQGLRTEGQAARAPISILRQVQIVAGGLALAGVVLGTWVNSSWYVLSGIIGLGLTAAGLSGTCLLANLLELLPWNRNR